MADFCGCGHGPVVHKHGKGPCSAPVGQEQRCGCLSFIDPAVADQLRALAQAEQYIRDLTMAVMNEATFNAVNAADRTGYPIASVKVRESILRPHAPIVTHQERMQGEAMYAKVLARSKPDERARKLRAVR